MIKRSYKNILWKHQFILKLYYTYIHTFITCLSEIFGQVNRHTLVRDIWESRQTYLSEIFGQVNRHTLVRYSGEQTTTSVLLVNSQSTDSNNPFRYLSQSNYKHLHLNHYNASQVPQEKLYTYSIQVGIFWVLHN